MVTHDVKRHERLIVSAMGNSLILSSVNILTTLLGPSLYHSKRGTLQRLPCSNSVREPGIRIGRNHRLASQSVEQYLGLLRTTWGRRFFNAVGELRWMSSYLGVSERICHRNFRYSLHTIEPPPRLSLHGNSKRARIPPNPATNPERTGHPWDATQRRTPRCGLRWPASIPVLRVSLMQRRRSWFLLFLPLCKPKTDAITADMESTNTSTGRTRVSDLAIYRSYPDYWTQGESLEDLEAHLRELHRDVTGGEIPNIRKLPSSRSSEAK